MHSLIRFAISSLLAVLFVLPLCIAQEAKDDRPNDKVSDEQKTVAEFVISKLDGEQQMLINGLRYLARPKYESNIMDGLAFMPCPLPSLDDAPEEDMNLPEMMRLWAFLQAGWPLDENLERELNRFIDSEHERYNDSLAAYAVPMLVCTMALRRDEIAESKDYREALKDKADDLMDIGMRVRKLTDEDSPAITRMVIQPMWYGNQLWRILMARCAVELNIDYNSNVVESDMKNLSHAAQKELGWISTQGAGMTPDNDLNSNLLALAAISQAMASDDREIDKATKRSFSKRLKYLQEILSRLEGDWPEELRTGGRLCLVRTLDKSYGPEEIKPVDWRFEIRKEGVENMFASGAVYTDHTLVREMGLFGRTNRGYAKAACETALACLSVCGGLYPEPEQEDSPEQPLKGTKKDDLDMLLESFSLLHASVLPEKATSVIDLTPRVNEAIERASKWLVDQQISDGSFTGDEKITHTPHPAYPAVAVHALLHAGLKPDDKVIQKGIEWLHRNVEPTIDGNGPPLMGMTSYDAGIILMMYERYYRELMEKKFVFETEGAAGAKRARQNVWNEIKPEDKKLITRLVRFLNDCYVGGTQGGWNYYPLNARGQTHSDNSISQFAACGYKAAALLGAPVRLDIFENEVRRVIAQYQEDTRAEPVPFETYEQNLPSEDVDERYSKGTYADRLDWDREIRPGAWGYRCGELPGKRGYGAQYNATAMAILASAKDELWANGKLGDAMRRDIDMHIFGAQLRIADSPTWERQLPEADPVDGEDEEIEEEEKRGARPAHTAGRSIYNWYAIERGCVMSGYNVIGGDVDWYYNIATWLLDTQGEDGSWRDVLHTSWAVLILRRAAPRCVTRPPVDDGEREGGPITERGGGKRHGPQKFPTTPGPVKPEKDEEEKKDTPRNPITPGPKDD